MQPDDLQSFAIVAIEALYFLSWLRCSSGMGFSWMVFVCHVRPEHIRHPRGGSLLVQASVEVTVLDAWTYDNQAVSLSRCASRSLGFTCSCLWVFLCILNTFPGHLGWNLHWSNWPWINSLSNTDWHLHAWITFYILSWFIISSCHLSWVPEQLFCFLFVSICRKSVQR